MSGQPSPDIPADDGAAADVRADAEAPTASSALAAEGSSGGPAWRAQLRRPDLEPCQFPGGCANTMEYAGSGRRPKYCYQVVGGVMHDRVNAKRILDGGTPARRRGEVDDALARPIARAGQSVTDQVAALIARLDHSSSELRDALDTLADPEAVAAEIAATQRAARAEVDAAQAVADEARAQARAARTDAEAARRSAAASDAEAIEAAEARADAELARDTAIAARDVLEGEIAQVRAELEQRDTELAAALAERDTLTAARDSAIAARDTATAESARVTTELQALTREHTRVETELADARRQVELLVGERDTAAADLSAARRDLDRAETDRARLADELHEVREQAVEHRAARAAAESSLAALREQLAHDVDRERAYGEQRLADAEARHSAQLAELRTDLARLRGQMSGRTPEADTGLVDDSGSGRGTSGRKARPRAAQRRPGPTATTTDTAPADETRPVAPDAQE
ncbi:hypothetical protein [Pseudonocardia alni]|uniref:hypothetical protein n=1 Tax=Pseudonocardia alni TaxID=33907 RepID=UPI00280AB895|nr:hypothetical protein [Pseudonocardia alni]